MDNKPSRKTFQSRMQEMIRTLREEIAAGVYAHGALLPSEEALAERFAISTKSVAKGLDILVHEGIVVKNRRVGTKVLNKQTVHFGYHSTMNRDIELKALLSEFHEAYPHIEVNPFPIVGDESSDVIVEMLMSGRFDVVAMNQSYFQNIVEKERLDLLAPLEWPEDTYPFLRNGLAIDGACYVRPVAISPIVLCYNKDHFAEAGIPEPDSGWTWKQLLRNAAMLSEGSKRYGFYCNLLESPNRWPVFLMQKAVAAERKGSRPWRPDVREMMDTLAFCRELMESEGVSPGIFNDAAANKLFLEGKLSMLMTTYFLMNEFTGSQVPFDVAPLPYFVEPRTLLVWVGVSISRQTKVPEAAQTFVDFMTSRATQEMISRKTISIPSSGSIIRPYGELSSQAPSRYPLYREIIPSYRIITEYRMQLNTLDTMQQQLQFYASGIGDDEELQAILERLLEG